MEWRHRVYENLISLIENLDHFEVIGELLDFWEEFQLKRGRIWNPKVKSAYLLGILKIPKGIILST